MKPCWRRALCHNRPWPITRLPPLAHAPSPSLMMVIAVSKPIPSIRVRSLSKVLQQVRVEPQLIMRESMQAVRQKNPLTGKIDKGSRANGQPPVMSRRAKASI